jgi:putative CocE/NonD family hydrolase
MNFSQNDETGQKAQDHNWAPYALKPVLPEDQVKTASVYLTMRDNVKIAISYYLPIDFPTGEKYPTILHATRYWRALERIPPAEHIRQYLANGYTWVSVDARGTGASFGYWSGPWSPEEVKDYDEVINWIVQQPWSSGAVGTVGVSYDGSTAEMTVSNCNPAIKASIPKFSLFDPLPDIATPGGIMLADFLQGWANLDDSLDRNEPRTVPLGKNLNLQAGVLPVDEDTDRSLLEQAVSEHAYNFNAYLNIIPQRFRDDHWDTDPTRTIADYTPFGFVEELQRSKVPIYGYSGYGDGAFALAAVHRFLTIRNPGSKLVLGPWSHGGRWHISPYVQAGSSFDHIAEEIRFFDQHLKGIDTGIHAEPAVHYYTMVAEEWKSAQTFPPPFTEWMLYFSENNQLSDTAPEEAEAYSDYQVTYESGSGDNTRWDTLLGGALVSYPDRAEEDRKLLCFDTVPLPKDLVITGMPIMELHLSTKAPDVDIFVYLEDIDQEGKVHLVSEGQLKALHRKLSEETPPYVHAVPYHSYLRKDAAPLQPGEITELIFHLLPVSYLFQKDHCIRIALAGADKDMFKIPNMPPPLIRYYRDAAHASHIRLPVER